MILLEDDLLGPFPIQEGSFKSYLPSKKIYLSQNTRWTFFKPYHPPKRHTHLNWTQVLISASMTLWLLWWPRIVVWPGFKCGITFRSSYTPLFPYKKLGACLGQVSKIKNPLLGSRTKKILSSNMSLCYTYGTGTFFEDYDVMDSNNLTLTLVLLSLWTFVLSMHESSPPFSLFQSPAAEQCCF